MIHILLYMPQIPNNTGAIIRLCANTGAKLHLIKPLGFELDDKKLKRAGLDYHEYADLSIWESLDDVLCYLQTVGIETTELTVLTSRTQNNFYDRQYGDNVALLFGPESDGLPEDIRQQFSPSNLVRFPMQKHSRSLNLANSVSIATYEVWRQQGFALT